MHANLLMSILSIFLFAQLYISRSFIENWLAVGVDQRTKAAKPYSFCRIRIPSLNFWFSGLMYYNLSLALPLSIHTIILNTEKFYSSNTHFKVCLILHKSIQYIKWVTLLTICVKQLRTPTECRKDLVKSIKVITIMNTSHK